MTVSSRRLLVLFALLVGCGGEDCPAPRGTWRAMSFLGGPGAREFPAAVWTGSELIVAGGDIAGVRRADGARYGPDADEWRPIADAPEPLFGHGAVWTGSELIVWTPAPGYAYDPAADSWRSIAFQEGAAERVLSLAAWTGDEVVVIDQFSLAGGGYDPAADRWRDIAPPPSADGFDGFGGAWTGSELIIWGATASGDALLPAGFRYAPASDSWTDVPSHSAMNGTGVWIGSELLMVGTEALGDRVAARFDPSIGSWRDAPSACGSAAHLFQATAWTGELAVVWGGGEIGNRELLDVASGATYDPETDAWTPMSADGAPSARSQASAFWTGSEVIVWGGNRDVTTALGDGARFIP